MLFYKIIIIFLILSTILTAGAQIRVSGRVVYANSGKPAANIPVSIQGGRHPVLGALPGQRGHVVSVLTDSAGAFALKVRAKGDGWSYSCMVAPPPGMMGNFPPLSLTEADLPNHDSSYTITFLLMPASQLRLLHPAPGEAIQLTVIEPQSGKICIEPMVFTAEWMTLSPLPALPLLIRWQREGQPARERLVFPGSADLRLE